MQAFCGLAMHSFAYYKLIRSHHFIYVSCNIMKSDSTCFKISYKELFITTMWNNTSIKHLLQLSTMPVLDATRLAIRTDLYSRECSNVHDICSEPVQRSHICQQMSYAYLLSRSIPYIRPNPSCPKFKTIPPASGGSRLQALPRPRTRSSPCDTFSQIPNSPPKRVGTWPDASDKQ